MNGVDSVKKAFEGAHMWFQGTVADVTLQQANDVPPGAVHSIGELMAHVLHCEDGMINVVILGRQSIWERDGWAQKTDIPLLLDLSPETGAYKCDPKQLLEYGGSVYQHLEGYLGGLSDADLDREHDLTAAGLGKMTLATFLLTLLLGNTYAHTGEISALKGIHGARGYPF